MNVYDFVCGDVPTQEQVLYTVRERMPAASGFNMCCYFLKQLWLTAILTINHLDPEMVHMVSLSLSLPLHPPISCLSELQPPTPVCFLPDFSGCTTNLESSMHLLKAKGCGGRSKGSLRQIPSCSQVRKRNYERLCEFLVEEEAVQFFLVCAYIDVSLQMHLLLCLINYS